jgi:hypothetical protein
MSGTIDHVNVSLKIDSLLLSALDLDTATDPLIINQASTLSNGTSANQASQQWHDTRTITASSTDSLDLAGSLTNAFGVTLTFTKIKGLFVRAAAGNTNDVQVTRPASNGLVWFLAAGDGFKLQPGAWSCFYDPVGVTVTAATGDILAIVNSGAGTSVTYDIWICGTD